MSGFAVCLLCGCTDKAENIGEKSTASLTPEQVECFRNVGEMKVEQAKRFLDLHTQVIRREASGIAVTVLERRANEQLCSAELQCYQQTDEIIRSSIFEGCLIEAEKVM